MDLRGITIAVVEDNELVRTMVCHVLQEYGATVGCAANGRECLTLLHQQSYDLVVTDIDMPVMNGFELLERLHTGYGDLPVVVMSGVPPRHHAAQLEARGIPVLTKPCDPAVLVETILRRLGVPGADSAP
jgi:two-component system capsular synthesis sensor histidine kinase RcsC